ncbi:uncharacterized protein NESG_01543 [Nematocida ausubeli]|uniref:Nucleoporin NSP1-like C-terminal domain-containing protein n=1 Tax=Nematocida ausubeli (strain ATCC PRA-371 / ERTm2) TaxID=1913371 RepID=A0A086J2Q2_NEMA1|nr:uncharacterized protein NESG_01543 [Nematocida ausubeli]KFG26420.1 hypothetical protein NESG_01543 [Nematocida ausubeli]
MQLTEEPYHYLQKKVESILEELISELNENVSEFKEISKKVYEVEEVILHSRGKYIKVSKEVEEELKRQNEIEKVLEYFEAEIDKLKQKLQATANYNSAEQRPNYSSIGDISSLITEFNELVSMLDLGIPNKINILLNKNINIINQIEEETDKMSLKPKKKTMNEAADPSK